MVVSRTAGLPPGPAIKEAVPQTARPMGGARVPTLPSLSGLNRYSASSSTSACPPPPPVPGRRIRYGRSNTYAAVVGIGGGVGVAEHHAARRVRFDLPAATPGDAGEGEWSASSEGGRGGRGSASLASGGGAETSTAAFSSPRVHDTVRYRKGTLPHPVSSALRAAGVAPGRASSTTALSTTATIAASAAAAAAASSAASAAANAELLRAAKEGDEDGVVEMLQQRVAALDVNCTDSSGRTAVSYAAAHGSSAMLDALLAVPNVDVNRSDNEGNTPLHFAAQAGFAEVVDALASTGGAHVDARNQLGFTPLMKAALQGRTKCAKVLLQSGASPALRDPARGLRAEQWARFCGRHVCAEAIEKFARRRLLDRGTAHGRWGSEPELGARLLLLHHTNSGPAAPSASSGGGGIKSRLRRAFRGSGGSGTDTSSSRDPSAYSLVSKLTSAALCVSTPALPAPAMSPAVKSLIRPLSVPRLQVTLATTTGGNASDTIASQATAAPTLPDRPPTARPTAGRLKKKPAK